MKKLILVFVMWPMMVSVFGQNQRKSITDTVFQLDQAIVKETIKKKVNLLNLDVPLKTLPMTVTTLSSDVLERKNILNLEDAVRFLPGVTVKDQLGAFYRFSVRGSNETALRSFPYTLQYLPTDDNLCNTRSKSQCNGNHQVR